MRDVDSPKQTRGLTMFLWSFFVLLPFTVALGILLIGGSLMALIISLLLNTLGALIAMLCAGFVLDRGVQAGEFAFGKRSWRSTRDQLSGDLERVKYHNRQGQHDEAFRIVNEILEKDPEYIDALALKAKVLWEGFGDSSGAWMELRRIMQLTPRDDRFHRWASDYYKKVTGGQGPINGLPASSEGEEDE